MRFAIRFAPLAALLVVVLACQSGRSPAADRALRVVATTTVVADLVRQIAGDAVSVDCLMPAGVDPHSYKATPRDADRLSRADLVVASGLHLEGKLANRLLDAGAGLSDPHVWFDAGLWSLGVPAVAEKLAQLDPPRAERYREAGRDYAARLVELDGEIRDRLASLPIERRVMVTAHDAFRYFGRAYDIEVVGIQGTSTEAEAGLGDINRLVDLVVTRDLPAVFVETSVSDRNVTALREGALSRGHTVRLGGRLYSDSLDAPGSGAETLEGALRANVATIVAGLSGDEPTAAPERTNGPSLE
jgi:manganese/zinc/iron transport system substrate-binding protein